MKRQIPNDKYCNGCPCIDEEGEGCCLYEKSLKYIDALSGNYFRLEECIEDKPTIIKS